MFLLNSLKAAFKKIYQDYYTDWKRERESHDKDGADLGPFLWGDNFFASALLSSEPNRSFPI